MNPLIGRKCEWTVDLRPMPGMWPGDDAPDSPCWDMSLVQKRSGSILDLARTIFGDWKALIQTDGGFKQSIIERDLDSITILP